jgi:uncharacterized protein DUF4384
MSGFSNSIGETQSIAWRHLKRHACRIRWMRPVPRHTAVVAIIVAVACGAARADDAVMVASTVPGYVPGMVVSSADKLSVPDGATATLLFESGEMLRLRGPFEGTLGQQQSTSGQSRAVAIADLFRLSGVDATVIGGTRSTGQAGPAAAMDEVQIEATHSATYCVTPATSVWITHPVTDQASYALRRMGRTRVLGWPLGAERIEWPTDVPIEDGSRFEIAANNAARAIVTFREMPAANGSAQVVKGLLLGCHEQFDDALLRIKRSATSPDVWITSDRGRRPTYHSGEPIGMTVMADADGYLYCVASKADGATTPIFPAGAIDGAQLRGAVPLSIPGARQPVGLRAFPGLARIRCWLADRDLTPELPHALQGAPTGQLPDQLAGDLDALFSRIGGTRIATDVLTVITD